MAYDVTTLTIKGTELLASATAANNLVVAGCDATQTFVPKASAVTVQNRPANPYSNTTSVRLEGATENHVFIRIFFKEGESTGGDVNTLYLYGHSASDPTNDYVIAVMSSQTPFHLPEDGDISNVYGTLLDIIYNVADGSVSTVTASVYATYSEYADLRDRAVTTHKQGQPTVGDEQTIYGEKTFVNDAHFNSAAITTADVNTGNFKKIKLGLMEMSRNIMGEDYGVLEVVKNNENNTIINNNYYVDGNYGACGLSVVNASGSPSYDGSRLSLSHGNSYNSLSNQASLQIAGNSANTWNGFSVKKDQQGNGNVATIEAEKININGQSKFNSQITVDPGIGNPCILREATNIAPNNYTYKTGDVNAYSVTPPGEPTYSYVAADLISLETQEVTYKLEATAGTTTESIDSFGLNCFSIDQSEQQGTVTNQYSRAYLYAEKKEFPTSGGGTEERRVGRVEIIANEPRNNKSAKIELLTDYDSSDNAYSAINLSSNAFVITASSMIRFDMGNLNLSIYPTTNGTDNFYVITPVGSALPVDIGYEYQTFRNVYADNFIGTANKATNDINNNAITSYYRGASTSAASIILTKGNGTSESISLNSCFPNGLEGRENGGEPLFSRVGGIGLFFYSGNVMQGSPGTLLDGSNLKPAGLVQVYQGNVELRSDSSTVSGTWSLLSFFNKTNTGDAPLVLAVRTL